MARRSPRRSFRRKLRWSASGPLDDRGFGPGWAEGDRGERYVITGGGEIYDLSVTLGDGTTTVLVSGVSPG